MMKKNQGRFRPRRTNFAQVSNTALHDDNLSLKAKGLYSMIQSLITMPDGDLLIWKIQVKCAEGPSAFERVWKELKSAGYLKQYRMPTGESGRFRYEYELLEEPDLTTSTTINLDKNGDIIINEQNEKTPDDQTPQAGDSGQKVPDDHPPYFAPDGQSTPCSEHPMENGGDNSNNDLNNIIFNNTISSNTKSVSLSCDDGLTDSLYDQIKEQIEYPYFEREMPEDISTINALVDCMVDILSSTETKVNGKPQSRQTLAPYIANVDSCTIREFMEHMRGKSLKGVKNIIGYYNSSLINYLREQELRKMAI